MISSRVLAPGPKAALTERKAVKRDPARDGFETTVGRPPEYSYSFDRLSIFAPGEPAGAGKPNQLPWPIQAKLEIGTVDDPLELEADRIASEVMRMPDQQFPDARQAAPTTPGLQAEEERRCANRTPLAESSSDHTSSVSSAPPMVRDVLRAPGHALDARARAFFEPRFGYNLSRVRLHTDGRAAESAKALHARAYTVGHQIVFGPGQYGHGKGKDGNLLAHELAHVVQQTITTASPVLRRQPETTTVRVDTTDKQLTQGTGGSHAIVAEYTARATSEPEDKTDQKKPGKSFDITLPLLIYPPAKIATTPAPPKVDVFVFFHGMRATYGEGTGKEATQGSEPIAVLTRLKDAVAASGRLGIAPQAPKTWVFNNDPKVQRWVPSTAQWREALSNVGFDGLINIALEKLSKDLDLKKPLVAGDIHVAGHSAGGQGIIQSVNPKGAATYSDKVRDLTLQDAGYSFPHWEDVVDWLLDGSEGKTVRVLISNQEGEPGAKRPGTRSAVLTTLNLSNINDAITAKKKTDTLEASSLTVPEPKDQKPKPGGFVIESELVIKNKKTGATQGTVVVFFSPGGKHYPTATATMAAAAAANAKVTTEFLGEATPGKYRVVDNGDKTPVYEDPKLSKAQKTSLKRDASVEVTSVERREPSNAKDETTQPFVAKIKTSDGKTGWMRLSNLAKE